MYGAGLWDAIWGYIALDTDLETIKGVAFGHAGETPGLGARITSPEIQDRYKGKKIYDTAGDLISVEMLRGENNAVSLLDDYHVDGMSGATLTARGVNDMLKNYFQHYMPFLKNIDNENQLGLAN